MKKKQVIHLYFNQHKIYAEIAEIEEISLLDILLMAVRLEIVKN